MMQYKKRSSACPRYARRWLLGGLFYSVALLSPVSGAQNASFVQDCAWLEQYVQNSSRDGIFPSGFAEITWTTGSDPRAPRSQKQKHKAVVSDIVKETNLPASYTDNQDDAAVLVFFYGKKEKDSDTKRIISELKSSPRAGAIFPGGYMMHEMHPFNTCSYFHKPTKSGSVGKIDVLIPYDRATGASVADAKSCIVEGLVKSFGINLKFGGADRVGRAQHCPKCLEADRRMAETILKNNKTAKGPMTVSKMLQELTSGVCLASSTSSMQRVQR